MYKLICVGKSNMGYSSAQSVSDSVPGAVEGIETVDCDGYSDALYAVVEAKPGETPGSALTSRDIEWLRVCKKEYSGPIGPGLVRQILAAKAEGK